MSMIIVPTQLPMQCLNKPKKVSQPELVATILKDLLDTLIPERLLIFLISIIFEYAANLCFTAGMRVIPPAKKTDLPEASFVASFELVAEQKLKFFILFSSRCYFI